MDSQHSSGKPKSARIAEVLRQDAADTKQELWDRIKAGASRPVNLVFAFIGILLYMMAEYVIEQAMGALIGIEAPSQFETLSGDLQSTSKDLKQSAQDIQSLLVELSSSAAATEDPALKGQLSELQNRLSGLTDLVQKTSSQTDKVATISEAMQADWERVKQATSGRINGVPDLLLSKGEAVEVCNDLSPFAVETTDTRHNRVLIRANKQRLWVPIGDRITLAEQDYIDFIGLDGEIAKFRLFCSSDSQT